MAEGKSTETSKFGAPGRISHDSSRFYKRKLYQAYQEQEEVEYHQNPLPESMVDRILQASSEDMSDIPDHSIHLMVTSPPYNAAKEYDDDLSLKEYLDMLHRVFSEVYRVLVTGGRACINIANLGRKPYIPLHAYLIQDLLDIGYLMRGEIIWNKAASASSSTAWGTWLSAVNPVLRDVHEYILVFSKGSFSRKEDSKECTIAKEEFLEYTKSVWTFPTESARNIGHPAPFPVELPRRLIQLYSFQGDAILDPFVGSGTTCVAALETGRHYLGYEIEASYIEIAQSRLKEAGEVA